MGIDPVTHNPRLDLLDLSSMLTPSLYNSPQLNISRLLDVQSLVNPELLRLATSLFSSSHHRENQNFLLQNLLERNLNSTHNHVTNDQIFMPPLTQPAEVQNFQNCVPFSNDAQLTDPQFSSQLQDWQCNETANNNYVDLQNYDYYGSDQSFNVDHLKSENLNFLSNNSNNMISLTNLSTPVSSPRNINSTSTIGEDEREGYSISSMMKFQFPDNLDVTCFM